MYFQSSGIRYVPTNYPNHQAAKHALLNGQDVDPKDYYFRLKLMLESDDPDPEIQDLVNKIVIASAVRRPNSILYQAYVVQ